MNDEQSPISTPAGRFVITAPTIDELSTIRYVHAQSLRAAALRWAGDDEIAAFTDYIYSFDYGEAVATAIYNHTLGSIRADGRLVATCGWSPISDEADAARVRWCHVLPMFANMGMGAALLAHAETAAEDYGHTTLVARASPNAVGFFERYGYNITSHGTRAMGAGHTLPVTFLRKHLRPPRSPAIF